MKLRSALRRLAVTSPFFLTAAAILRFEAAPLDVPADRAAPLVLIVTTESLHPAFRALELWNETRGCPAQVLALDSGTATGAELSAAMSAAVRRAGATDILLGGDERMLPVLPGALPSGVSGTGEGRASQVLPVPVPAPESLPEGVQVGRIPVRDLGEAWAFVEACRSGGWTLDQLIGASAGLRAGRHPVRNAFALAEAYPDR